MRRRIGLAIGVAALIGAARLASAADHTDGTTSGTGALSDPSADITDVFAWMSTDTTTITGKVNLVMDVFPGATTSSLFSTSVKYVFHTYSLPAYQGSPVPRDVICTFAGSTTQTLSCWVTDPSNNNAVVDYLSGDASSATTPLVATDSKVQAFAGLRDDPFFFNLAGFHNATSAVAAAIADYSAAPTVNHNFISGFDTTVAQCPVLSSAARSAVVGYLSADCTGAAAAKDTFRKPEANPGTCVTTGKPALVTTGSANEPFTGNVLAIVLSVDKSLLTSGGSILSVWGATTK